MLGTFLGHTKMLAIAGVLGAGVLGATQTASAHNNWGFGISIGPSCPAPVVAPPVYVPAPQPVYAPAPVYTAPAYPSYPQPVYTPAPVYAPPPVVVAPYPAPMVVSRPAFSFGFSFGGGHDWHHHGGHWGRR